MTLTWTLAGALLLSACGQAGTAATPADPTAAPASGSATAAPGTGGVTSSGVTVRLGYFPNLTHAAALVGVERGSFQQALGESNPLDIKTFNAGPALIEALFANELDIAYVGPNPAINGYVKSRGEALRIIAGASSGGALFITRPEANINGPQDLKGKKIASPQLGGTQDVALRHYIQENGLKTTDEGGDVAILPTQNPDILTLFTQGQIDGAWVPEPWATRLILEGKGKVFIDERTLWEGGKFVTTNIIVSKKFLDAHPDLVRAFLEAHVDTVDFINANPDEAKQIVNAEIERITTKGLPDDVLTQALTTTDITYDPLPATLFESADYAYALGFLGPEKPDLSGLFDLTLLNDVLTARNLPTVTLP